jgi:hypothetical protein
VLAVNIGQKTLLKYCWRDTKNYWKSLEVVAAAAAAAAKLNIIPTRILSLLAAPVQLEHLQ